MQERWVDYWPGVQAGWFPPTKRRRAGTDADGRGRRNRIAKWRARKKNS